MVFNYKKLFEQLLKEIDVKNIGFFPGKFKPPHKGHFKTASVAAKQNDVVLILISDKEHEGYTAEKSFNIWSIYKKFIPNIFPYIVTPTPVLACYDLANILNNGEYKASPKSPVIKSNANEIVDNVQEIKSYVNVGNNINLNLYSSPEDQSRFNNILKAPYMGRSVMKIEFKPVDRLTSATAFRNALKTKKGINNFLPSNISNDDKLKIINILNDSV